MTIEVSGEEVNLKFKLLNWKLLKHVSSHLKNTGATYHINIIQRKDAVFVIRKYLEKCLQSKGLLHYCNIHLLWE